MAKERKAITKEKVPGLLEISKNSWRREEGKERSFRCAKNCSGHSKCVISFKLSNFSGEHFELHLT